MWITPILAIAFFFTIKWAIKRYKKGKNPILVAIIAGFELASFVYIILHSLEHGK